MSREAFAYVAGSAGLERTASANSRAFDEWQIVPRGRPYVYGLALAGHPVSPK